MHTFHRSLCCIATKAAFPAVCPRSYKVVGWGDLSGITGTLTRDAAALVGVPGWSNQGGHVKRSWDVLHPACCCTALTGQWQAP